MKKALMIAATALLLIVLCMPVALAADDTTAPVLTAINFSSASFNRGDTLTVYVAATELESGFDLTRCTITFGVMNPVEFEPLLDYFTMKLDTLCDGGVQGSVVLDERIGGVFEVIDLVLTDNRGNVNAYSNSLENLPYASFTLVSDYVKPAPAESPTITSYTISLKTAHVGDTVTFTVAGNHSTGISSAKIVLSDPESYWYEQREIICSPIQGQINTFTGSFTIPADMPDSTYYSCVYLTANSGEKDNFWCVSSQWDNRLRVINPNVPRLPKEPKFISYSTSAKTLIAGQSITVSVAIDPKYTSYIQSMNAIYCRLNTRVAKRDSISVKMYYEGNGVYSGSAVIPPTVRSDSYGIIGIGATLNNLNIVNFSGDSSLYTDEEASGRYLTDSKLFIASPFVITGTDNASILVGDSFDAMAGVTVNNAFAGDITGKVTTAGGDIDTSTPGIYLVKYQISDTIIADGTPYDVSYTDYRWIGVTEAMPQSAGDPLVITDGIIEVGASSSEASLTQDGKAIAYTNVLTEEGKYTISASVSESSGTTGVAFSGIAPDVQHAVALMGPPSQTSRRVILEASDTRGIETTFAGTGTTAPGTKSAMLMIDREGPVYSPRCYINSDTNITVQANAQDVAGIGVTKWAKGEQSVSFFAIGGTEFSGSFQADSYGKYTIYARDTLGNESAEVVNIQAVAAPSSVQVTADFSGGNTISWGGVSGVSGYQVCRSVTADGTYECLAETASRKYTDTAVTPRQTYYYIVRAYKTSGSMRIYSAASRMVSAAAVYTTPEGVSASMASYNSVTVSWNPVDGASGYQLYRATSENGTYSLVKTTTATSYANTSLKTGTRYYYKVRAYRTVNRRKVFGSDSAVVSATPVLSPVAAASAVAYYPTSIKVTWSSVPGRTKYEVWRADSPGGTPVLVKTTTSTYYKDTTRTPFVTYYYFIKVYRSVSGSKVYAGSASPTVSATPTLGNVANVRAAVSSASSVKVSWSAVTGASGYEVWRCDTTDGAYTLVKSTSGKSYTDKNLIPNKTYYYQVVAYRKVGTVHVCSTPCSPVSAMPYLGPVTNAAAVRSSATAIKLTWSAVSGRTGYEIYRSTSSDGEYVLIGTTTKTSYFNSSLTTGVTVYYKIRAYCTVRGVRYYSQTLADAAVVSATP